MSAPAAFERRTIPTRELPLLTIEITQAQTQETVAQLLGEHIAAVFYAITPLPRYNVDILMSALRQSGAHSIGTVDVQLSTLVHLIKCAVNTKAPPAAARDGLAETLIRQLDLPAAFKLNVKQTLFDRGQINDPTMAVLLES